LAVEWITHETFDGLTALFVVFHFVTCGVQGVRSGTEAISGTSGPYVVKLNKRFSIYFDGVPVRRVIR
jgi:hypothetical protein